jgi:hypothetical protein
MGFIGVSAEDVAYFGPERAWRMVNPMVRVYGGIAMLTFVDVYDQLTTSGNWNVTEVYRLIEGDSKLIHSRWAEARG